MGTSSKSMAGGFVPHCLFLTNRRSIRLETKKNMFTSTRRNTQFIFASRSILNKVSERLNCPTKWQGYANLLPQHENLELMTGLYVSWCQELIIHINRNYKILSPDYPIDCVDAIKAVLTCYNKGQIPNSKKWIRGLSANLSSQAIAVSLPSKEVTVSQCKIRNLLSRILSWLRQLWV